MLVTMRLVINVKIAQQLALSVSIWVGHLGLEENCLSDVRLSHNESPVKPLYRLPALYGSHRP